MQGLDIENLKSQINNTIDAWYKGELARAKPQNELATVAEVREMPKDKRVVRTKSTGDRVYLLDEANKTRAWVTNPDILQSHGFELTDVVEIDDNELLKYTMSPALYRVADASS
jgi:hypothetical protein